MINGPHLELPVIAGCDAATAIWRDPESPAFPVCLRNVRLDAVLSGDVPNLDQRILAGGQQKRLVLVHFHIFATDAILLRRIFRVDKVQPGDLTLVSSQLEQACFGDQIPYDDVRVFGTTGQSDAALVKSKDCDCRLVTIEADNDGRRARIPNAYASVCIPNGEDVWIHLASADDGDLVSAGIVAPAAHKLAFLDIPAQHLLVGSGVCASGACRPTGARLGEAFGGPDNVRGSRRDHAESVGLLIFAVPRSAGALHGGALRVRITCTT